MFIWFWSVAAFLVYKWYTGKEIPDPPSGLKDVQAERAAQNDVASMNGAAQLHLPRNSIALPRPASVILPSYLNKTQTTMTSSAPQAQSNSSTSFENVADMQAFQGQDGYMIPSRTPSSSTESRFAPLSEPATASTNGKLQNGPEVAWNAAAAS